MTSLRSAWSQLTKLSTFRQAIPEMIDRLVLYLSIMSLRSQLPIDVLIPAAEKDADVLSLSVQGIRRNIRHPLSKIFIVAPESARIREVCRDHQCEFVPEQDLVPRQPESIGLVVNGVDRSGWIFQQFLKLSGDAVVSQAHFLVVDADTVMVRPQVFERDGRIVFNYSDEYYGPYFTMYERLLQEAAACPVSFTSHQMLFSVDMLREMRGAIERVHGCPWQDAILRNLDRTEMSSCSDYDTYGQYAFKHHAERIAIEYWFNLNLSRRKLRTLPLLELQYGGRYKSVSFHSYRK